MTDTDTDTDNAASAQRQPEDLEAFFQPPNQLRLGTGIPELEDLVAFARRAIMADPPQPLLLPARLGADTYYYAIAFTTDQSRTVRDLLRSHIGTTWTDFDGRNLTTYELGPLDQVAVALAGDSSLVYRFHVAPEARNPVRDAITALSRALEHTPQREARIALPVGRLMGDFNDACAAGAEQAAQAAYAKLAADHRISAVNSLFLRTQLYATFERWTELETHPQFDDLLKLPRPAPASDAIARLAMSKLPDPPNVADFTSVATRFGALITSVSAIRSPHGARYYTLWALHGGESAAALHLRLTDAGWAPDPVIDRLTGTPSAAPSGLLPTTNLPVEEMRAQVRECIEAGRFDTAIDLLAAAPVSDEDLPVVATTVANTLTSKAIALLELYRAHYGDEALRQAAPFVTLPSTDDVGVDLVRCLTALFRTGLELRDRTECVDTIRSNGLTYLRKPGGVAAIADALQDMAASAGETFELAPGIDVCIDLVRDLTTSEAPPADALILAQCVLELWAIHDRTGDRHRAARIVQMTSDLLEVGVNTSGYDEIVELLRAGWDPFLKDADLPLSLDLLELLLAFRPEGTTGLDIFARPLLSRINSHSTRSVAPAVLAVAVDLAPWFGLNLEAVAPALLSEPTQHATRPGTKIALYSLLEQALERAARILRHRYPDLQVVTSSDHVATNALRNAARKADLLIIMDQAATHAATDALRGERPSASIRYAVGKGSSSLIEAAELWLKEQGEETSDHVV
jgi:hypothetical protein